MTVVQYDHPPEKINVRGILLSSDVGEEVWTDHVRSNYTNPAAIENLLKYDFSNEELRGSSPFMNLALANMDMDMPNTLPNGHRPAAREDIEKILENDPTFFNKINTDFALYIMDLQDFHKPNEPLTKSLYTQLNKRGIALPELPRKGLLIPYSVLGRPAEDNESEYGLNFEINPELSSKEVSEKIEVLSKFKDFLHAHRDGLNRGYRGFAWSSNYWFGQSGGDSGRVIWAGELDSPTVITEGRSDQEWKNAFEKAGMNGAYDTVRSHLK